MRGLGHDVDCVQDWEKDPGDERILTVAHETGRVVVTRDQDFGTLAVLQGKPHAGIIRIKGFGVRDIAGIVDLVTRTAEKELGDGAIVTVDPKKLRIRRKPERIPPN